jgi:hypothetical protein
VIDNDADIQNEICPQCGEKQLKIFKSSGFSEIRTMFYSGG